MGDYWFHDIAALLIGKKETKGGEDLLLHLSHSHDLAGISHLQKSSAEAVYYLHDSVSDSQR